MTGLAIVITLPATVEWEEYEHELEKAAAGDILNFKVSSFPKDAGPGDRCYICHKGKIMGWHCIMDFHESPGFVCTTTGNQFPPGKYIRRTGKFTPVTREIPWRGSQGYRYCDPKDFE